MINENCAKAKCCEPLELIENYDKAVADETQVWCCHHRLGVRDGVTVTAELKANGMYYHRPANELIFVTYSQHNKLHPDKCAKGGKKGGPKGVKKMRAKLTREILSKGGKKGGKKAGPKNAKTMNAKLTYEQRVKGGKAAAAKLTHEQRSKCAKGKSWWNNGVVNKRSKECPGPGWKRGMLKRS